MGDLLQSGSQWLADQRHRYLTHEVTYRRGDQSVVLAATVGRSLFEQATGYGIAMQSEARDYIVRAEDLALGGTAVLPQAGDVIEEMHGDLLHTYEVMTPGGEPCYRWADADKISLRIHTKWTGAQS